MKVQNMTGSSGNKVANQFIITDEASELSGNCVQYFQSYNSIIAKIDKFHAGGSQAASMVRHQVLGLFKDDWEISQHILRRRQENN